MKISSGSHAARWLVLGMTLGGSACASPADSPSEGPLAPSMMMPTGSQPNGMLPSNVAATAGSGAVGNPGPVAGSGAGEQPVGMDPNPQMMGEPAPSEQPQTEQP